MKNLNFIDINFNVYSEDNLFENEATICIMISCVTLGHMLIKKKNDKSK